MDLAKLTLTAEEHSMEMFIQEDMAVFQPSRQSDRRRMVIGLKENSIELLSPSSEGLTDEERGLLESLKAVIVR